jgi:hypothetical protein
VKVYRKTDDGQGAVKKAHLSLQLRWAKDLLLKNHWARTSHIYMKAFRYNVDSNLFKLWSPGVGRGHNTENHIYKCLYWKKKSSPEPAGQFQSNLVHINLG